MVKFCLEEDWNNGYEKKEILQSQYNALKEDGFMTDKLTDTSNTGQYGRNSFVATRILGNNLYLEVELKKVLIDNEDESRSTAQSRLSRVRTEEIKLLNQRVIAFIISMEKKY